MTDDARLPIDPASGEPLPPRAQPGYYPGFDTLDQAPFWDEATRRVVLDRVENVPPIRFFADDLALARAVFDRILPQDDRDEAHRIPVLNYVDKRLYEDIQDGYRFVDMPPDADAYRLGLQGIDAIARHRHEKSFVELSPTEQDEVLLTLRDDVQPAGNETWQHVGAIHFFEMLVTDAVDAYYAHPYAWDEIGYGGPAYPRGYMRLEGGRPEPWEVDEQPYAWEPPPDARSGEYRPLAGLYTERARPSQAGSH